jgi:tetratricopeptide (TPR) repeat protein
VGGGEGVARPLVTGVKGLAWRRVVLAAAIVVLIGGLAWWLRPYALAAYHVEAGGRALEAALEPVFVDWLAPEQVMDAGRLDAAEAYLQTALRWQGESVQARRLLARVYLSTGRPEAALKVLKEAVELRPENPVFHLELGDAYNALGNTEAAIEAYEEGRVGSRAVPLATNTLKVAEEKALQGSGDVAIELWQKTLEADPGNLYALYRLAGVHQELGDEKQAERYEERLRYFELESVEVPMDFRLAAFQGRAMAGLMEEGIWEREKLLNVISYQVWQFAEGVRGLMTERLLETVLERRPEDADVLFYRAELYQRRGELDQAKEAYQQVLAADTEYAQAYLRLGSVAEERGSGGAGEQGIEDLMEAAAWYDRYHEVAPDDLLGLKWLAEVCGALEGAGVEDSSCRAAAERMRTADEERRGQREEGADETGEGETPAAVMSEVLAERTDDRRIVAELLDVPVDDVNLGPNLVENGGFEAWNEGSPEEWEWSDMFSREPFNRATFAGGAERLLPYEEGRSARVDGLWVQELESNSPARAGFWHSAEISVEGRTPHMVSFCYSTDGIANDDRVAIWLSDNRDASWRSNLWLTNTRGGWINFVAIAWSRSAGKGEVRPLIRSFGAGSLRVDDVQIRSIELSEGAETMRKDTRVWEGWEYTHKGA